MQAHAIIWEKNSDNFCQFLLIIQFGMATFKTKVFIVLCRLLKSFVFKVIRFFQNYTLRSTSLRRVKSNYFLTWISAQVKEMGGFVFRNCEIHFSRVFWVWNKWKMFDFRAVARKSHFSRVSNPKYKGNV